MGTAAGWGDNPKEGAMYFTVSPAQNDGETPYTVTVKDEPQEGNGFWSITVYVEDNYLAPNEPGVNAYSNVTAEKNEDGSITINAGGCEDGRINCASRSRRAGTTCSASIARSPRCCPANGSSRRCSPASKSSNMKLGTRINTGERT